MIKDFLAFYQRYVLSADKNNDILDEIQEIVKRYEDDKNASLVANIDIKQIPAVDRFLIKHTALKVMADLLNDLTIIEKNKIGDKFQDLRFLDYETYYKDRLKAKEIREKLSELKLKYRLQETKIRQFMAMLSTLKNDFK